jgi:beta-glucosidase-like glycosyl hydrolase
VYAPTLDVARDQRWGRVEDTYGEDPYLTSKLGVEMVKGLQENYTVVSTAKHFAVYSVGKERAKARPVLIRRSRLAKLKTFCCHRSCSNQRSRTTRRDEFVQRLRQHSRYRQ